MWKCPNCKETVPDEFDGCWNCGRVPEEVLHARPQSTPPEAEPEGEPAPPVADPSFPAMSGDGMSRREIAAMVSRSVALVILAQVAYVGAALLGAVVYVLAAPSYRTAFTWDNLFLVLLLCALIAAGGIVAIVYWKKAPAIAARMVPENPEPVTGSSSFNLRDVMVVAFSTAGLFVFLDGIRELVDVLYRAHLYNYSVYEFYSTAALWSSGGQLAVALWLILGARGICGAIYWMRTAGAPNFDDASEAAREEPGIAGEP